jgi:hypothetical protein
MQQFYFLVYLIRIFMGDLTERKRRCYKKERKNLKFILLYIKVSPTVCSWMRNYKIIKILHKAWSTGII